MGCPRHPIDSGLTDLTHPIMTTVRLILAVPALTFVTVLAIMDLRTHRIPNRLTVLAATAALLLNIGVGGLEGAVLSGTGLVVGLAIFLPLFLAGQFGAGDVKGMAAVGAFLGPYGVVLAACWTLIAGFVGGLVFLFATGGWIAVRSLFGRWIFRAHMLGVTGEMVHVEPAPDDPARRHFPYGFALAFGTAASVILTAAR